MPARQWFGLIAVYASIPLILLLCGGDLHWWQAWLFAFLFIVFGVGGRIWGERRHPGLSAERQDREKMKDAEPWDKILAPLMALSLGFPMVIVAGLDHRFAWSPEISIWLGALGFFFILIGYAFASWAFAENAFFSSVVRIQTERGHEVCDTGPYRVVRHPGYAGNLLPLVGMVLALSSWWTIAPALFALIVTVIRTELEDKFLQKELAGYAEYAMQVRYRLVPGIY